VAAIHNARSAKPLGIDVKPPSYWISAFALALLVGGCVATPYGVPSAPAPAPGPSTFNRSWDAALGAAADAGVQVTSADRASGRISGSKAGEPVVIMLLAQSDGSVRVSSDAPTSTETNPTLDERWLASYQRRMGR
jgi:hypothetical protein